MVSASCEDAILFQQYAFRLEGIVANPFHLQKDVIIGIVFNKVAILIRPYVFDPGKSIDRNHIIRRDVQNVRSVDCKEQIAAVQLVSHKCCFEFSVMGGKLCAMVNAGVNTG